MTILLDLFCSIDDFCQIALPEIQAYQISPPNSRKRDRSLCSSEIITILVAFHHSHYRDFKAFYMGCICQNHRSEFPGIVSYSRFIEFVPSVLVLQCIGTPVYWYS
jgi:hypothetical protein